jgi:hypothetical protein
MESKIEVKLDDGFVYIIEKLTNGISVQRLYANNETMLICLRDGNSIKVNNNMVYII